MLQGWEKIKNYSPYLEEIRKRLLWVLASFLGGGILGIIFSSNIILFFLRIFNFSGVNIIMTSPSQLIDLSIYTGLIIGIMVAIPTLGYNGYSFIANALNQKEKKIIKFYAFFGIILFILGSVFGAGVTQLVIGLYSNFSSGFAISNIWDIQKFFNQVIVTALLMGFIFQMPLVLTILIRFGVVKRSYLVSKRKYVYAAIIIVAVLLPSTDILSLVFETLPLLFLFEIALLLNRDY